MGKSKKTVQNSFKQKNKKNRQNKVSIVFDEQARTEYLTGFRKRKNERRKKAKEEAEKFLKDEKKRIKEKKRAALRERLEPFKDEIDVLDELVTPQTFDLPQQMVTVTDVTAVDFVGSSGVMLGTNNTKDSDEEDGTEEQEEVESDTEGKKSLADDSGKSRGNKRKWKPPAKRHHNYQHLSHKKKPTSKGDRMRQKRQIKKQQRNKPT